MNSVVLLATRTGNSSGRPSGASRVAMGFLRLMKFKDSTLTRVRAGLSFVDSSGQQPHPNRSFAKKVLVTIDTIDGHAVYTMAPRDKITTVTVLYLHGGAYSATFVSVHWKLFEELIVRTGCTIVAPDYPLPPEAAWSAAWVMVRKVYAELVNNTSHSAPILMGDSAGGGFALAFAQELATGNLLPPQRLILLSPWLDLAMSNPDIEHMEDTDPLLSVEALRISGQRWGGETPVSDWHLSPLFGPIEKLPPVSLFTGTADVLNPDARKLRERFADQKLALDYREYAGMMHVWMLFPFPESRKARAELVNLLQ